MINITEDLVSIIIPAFNSEQYIEKTLKSVQKQTYSNWEAIIIDDFSHDNTSNIVKSFTELDSRFIYIKLDRNSGAAVARNSGLLIAKGKFIAFLDSDDLWYENKLSFQIHIMNKNNLSFTCTSYNKISDRGHDLKKIIVPKKISNYDKLLKNCPGNSTVIYDANLLGKQFIPDIKKRNDYVMWLQVIKTSVFLYGIQEVLSSHRVRNNSISSNKVALIKYHWFVYRNIEKLGIIKSIKLVLYWITKKFLRL